jgi:hypothetical protein
MPAYVAGAAPETSSVAREGAFRLRKSLHSRPRAGIFPQVGRGVIDAPSRVGCQNFQHSQGVLAAHPTGFNAQCFDRRGLGRRRAGFEVSEFFTTVFRNAVSKSLRQKVPRQPVEPNYGLGRR